MALSTSLCEGRNGFYAHQEPGALRIRQCYGYWVIIQEWAMRPRELLKTIVRIRVAEHIEMRKVYEAPSTGQISSSTCHDENITSSADLDTEHFPCESTHHHLT